MICEGCGQAAISTTKAGRPICADCIDEGYGDECHAPTIGEGSQMSDELNVSALAAQICGCADRPQHIRDCALIRDYGDKRYQQAIADVVEWLAQELPYDVVSGMVARRFGKDA